MKENWRFEDRVQDDKNKNAKILVIDFRQRNYSIFVLFILDNLFN